MSSCKRCGGNGFIDGWVAGSGSYTASIQQCPNRCDISKYSAEVMRRMNSGKATERRPIPTQPSTPRLAEVKYLNARHRDQQKESQ